MSYSVQNIRNVCLVGHSGSGKTALAESLLFMTNAVSRMGKSADGNTVCDFDPEEIRRQISISTAIAPIEYKGCKINLLDTPGAFDFAGEVMEALRAADAAIIVCSAKDGISVGFEKVWKYCEERNMPRFIYISKTDEENSDYNATFNALRERYGNKIAPLVVPMWDAGKVTTGLIDTLNKRAYELKDYKRVEVDIPADKEAVVAEFNEALKESVAETSDEMMDKYFGGEDFTYPEMINGLRQGVRELSMFPVLFGSAVNCIGSLMLMDYIVELLPNPAEGNFHKATLQDGETTEEFVVSPGGVPTAFVFKTMSDQYGKYSMIKVLSGVITSDLALVNSRTGDTEKLGRLYKMTGKKAEEVKELTCGDIGAIGKMEKVKTGDTLCDPRKVVALKGIPFAEPCYSKAIAPKTRGQDDKVAAGLARMNEEDPSFSVVNNAETRQVVLSGAGDMQLDVLVSRLKSRFGVEAELSPARVPYRETIKKKVEAHGRHKKQTGGSGQFGDVWVRFEPQYETDDMIFAEEVFGGSVPKNFFPAVEKGLREAANKGVLAGYPLVGLKATLYDGSYHPVDSNEMAFKTAAQLAYKEGIANANPTILEPIGALKVTIPDSYMGDVMGDLNKRRGRVMGMNPTG
ncbi:elongation factor G, partial [Evtepia sp.]|uniref:elongation factor G n=1 Tax=Evtepia sp. TaxID=2773933 RepID=UPI003F175BAB